MAILANSAIAAFPVDPKLIETIIPIAELRDANPIDTINWIVWSVLSTNTPDIHLGTISPTPQRPTSLHPNIVTKINRNHLVPISITRTNISAYTLIQEIASAGQLDVIFSRGLIYIEEKKDSNKGVQAIGDKSPQPDP